MKRNLLILACLFTVSVCALAQKKKKKSENQGSVVSALTIPGTAFLRPVKTEMEVEFDYKLLNAPLPKFNIVNYENKNISKDVLESGGNLFLIMFNPTCEHCEDETRLITQNIFMFKKSKVLLVAADVQTPNLSYFESNLKCSQFPSTITVSIDSARIIRKLFTYAALPQINIYDGKSLRLIKTFEGFVPLDSLRQYIQ
jgi:hypothetical protein